MLSRSTSSHSFVATSLRRFSKAVRGPAISALSFFASSCIRLIIARDMVGLAIISGFKTGARVLRPYARWFE